MRQLPCAVPRGEVMLSPLVYRVRYIVLSRSKTKSTNRFALNSKRTRFILRDTLLERVYYYRFCSKTNVSRGRSHQQRALICDSQAYTSSSFSFAEDGKRSTGKQWSKKLSEWKNAGPEKDRPDSRVENPVAEIASGSWRLLSKSSWKCIILHLSVLLLGPSLSGSAFYYPALSTSSKDQLHLLITPIGAGWVTSTPKTKHEKVHSNKGVLIAWLRKSLL